jgi:squalene synthase HpnC
VVNPPALPGQGNSLAIAYAYCERLARAHYENFPVASRLLPPPMRPHIAAIYAFARRADDFADEPGPDVTERLRRLDEWSVRLDRGMPVLHTEAASAGDDLIFVALENTIGIHRLPLSLFHDLLSAFRQDVVTTRYATWREVLDYCRRSANPVGRLVLRVAGHESPELDAQSDAICTALQLTNFWQDLAVDWKRGRLYVPLEERDRAWAQDADLERGHLSPEWRAALQRATERTRALFHAGRPVCDAVRGRLRWELRFTWLGGMRILGNIEAPGFDPFRHRPILTPSDALSLAWQAIRWKTDESSR